MSIWYFLLQYQDIFISIFYVVKESEVVAGKSSIKKAFLKTPQNSKENTYAGVSFAIKLQAGGLQLH